LAMNYDPDANMDDGSCTYEVGINSQTIKSSFISCAPNPSHTYTTFNYRFAGEGNGIISLTTIAGGILEEIPVSGPEGYFFFQLDLAPGLYFYRLESAGAVSESKKLVVY
jgi:hypothetical protein